MSDDHKPWDQQDGETAKAFAAFCVYREMPPGERSLELVADKVYNGVSTGNRRWIQEWSRLNDWVARAKLLDAHKQRLELDAIMSQRVENKRRRVALLTGWMAKWEQLLDSMDNPPEASVKEITAAIKMVAEQLRKEFDDEPVARHQVEGGLALGVQAVELEGMSPEEKSKRWRQLTGREDE